jgi:hypothetical protein
VEAQHNTLAIKGAREEEVVQPTNSLNTPQPQFESMNLDVIRYLVNALNNGHNKRIIPGNNRRNINNGNASRNYTNTKCYNSQGWDHMQGECPSPRSSGRGGSRRFGGFSKKHLKEYKRA